MASLRHPAQFQQVISGGRKLNGRLALLFIRESGADVSRFGVSSSSRAGTVVVRNRLKRLLREALRLEADRIQPGFDVVLIAKASAVGRGLGEFRPDVRDLLLRAGLYAPPEEDEP